jgi:hypothetical protein
MCFTERIPKTEKVLSDNCNWQSSEKCLSVRDILNYLLSGGDNDEDDGGRNGPGCWSDLFIIAIIIGIICLISRQHLILLAY